MNPRSPNNQENAYYRNSGVDGGVDPIVGSLYASDNIPWEKPDPVTLPDGEIIQPRERSGKPSIFNRYSIFYFNSTSTGSPTPEDYLDSPNRLGSLGNPSGIKAQSVIEYPTAKNIIAWASQGGVNGGTNAIDYAWEDFLWCKNYGTVPNNYMITLRRFSIPVSDDLTDFKKQPSPDIARMIAWVDGESNKWEDVGLKFTTKMAWKRFESEIQSLSATSEVGSEGKLIGGPAGNILQQAASLTQPGMGAAQRNSPQRSIDPFSNKNQTYGDLDVVKEMMVRDKGIEFIQEFNIKFEYELKSIDGINPKVAMMDLLSNILICTSNRAAWWGGDIRYHGGDPRRIKPLGDPSKLQSGDLGGYLKSISETISSRLDGLTGGSGLSLDGIANAAKNLGGGLMDSILGGALDKMGRPEAQALNALLSGEDTGEWHIMIGNPANPIVSIGNLILDETEISFNGALGPDDFPNKLTVTCKLKPARPRDRIDMMSMFHRNNRMVLTTAPSATKYAGNTNKPRVTTKFNSADRKSVYDENEYFREIQNKSGDLISRRFPNQNRPGMDNILDNTAQGIY